MYLKRLEAYGFKTFAQRTVFDFPPGVTAVVGPNGSGKSNLADAVRWVLGEQSFANLRSKRTDDLIFGGGHGRAPMGFAEVFLTIDNSDRLLPLPYDEVTIGRRAYRSGENEYTINRARVRLRDVLDAVAPLGSSYTIINQGLVDLALALQPEERRRLFEDAAEIGPYQAKKNEAERRLRETETNLVRLSDLISELEPQLRTLKRQARDAEAVGEVEAELHSLLRVFYLEHWRAVGQRLDRAVVDEQRIVGELGQARALREQVAAALLDDRQQLRQQRASLEQQRADLSAIEQRHQQVSSALAVTRERSAGLSQRTTERQQRRAELDATIGSARQQIAALEQHHATLEAALAEARAQLQAAESTAQRQQHERRAAEQALGQQREALIRASAALQTEQNRQQDLARRLDTIATDRAALDQSIEQQRARCDQRGADAAAAQQAVDAAEQRIATANRALDEIRARQETARRERERLDEQLTAAKRAQSELQARFDALSRLARSFEGTFAGVRAAMQWAEREKRAGFALVSSLLRVPSELETAIEVALGSRLQNVVVERWADAEAAIAQLKRSNAGRATFLPLDTLRVSRTQRAPSLPGIRGVAADLIEVDAQATPIGAYLLGRTLIADDLPAARQALPRLEGGWTIVTLSGEQIATGGAVTGGAATRETGTLRRERELRELPKQLDRAGEAVDQAQADRHAAVQQIEALQAEQRQAEIGVRDARAGRDEAQRAAEARRRVQHRAEDELASLIRRQAAIEREHATLIQQRERGSAALAAAQQAHDAAAESATAAESVLADQLVAIGDDEQALLTAQRAATQHEADLRQIAAELRSRRQALADAEAEIARLDRAAEQLQIEAANLSTAITDLAAQQQQLQADVQRAAADLRAAQQTLREHEQHLEGREADDREVTGRVLALEGSHAEAAIEVQRRRAERDSLWERAAEDNIDIEQLVVAPPDEAAPPNDETLPQRIEQLRNRLRRMGPVNALAPQEYQATQERYTFLSEQLADVRSAAGSLREAIHQLDHVMQEQFSATFEAVAHIFSQTFTRLFGGGSARLVMQSEENGGTTGGIDIIAQPPGKRQLNLQLLSGGERALTAAALLFAILNVNPSPFCILDEVDAALDEANVVRFREALLELAAQTQFILITHNRGTVEAADTLYGITMSNDGGSRVLSLRLEEVGEDGTLALASPG